MVADCRRDPAVCNLNARCERRGAQYFCVCMSGYEGDGYDQCIGKSVCQNTSYSYGRQLCAIFDKNINLCLHFTCVSDFAVCDDWWFLAIIPFSSSDLCFFTA